MCRERPSRQGGLCHDLVPTPGLRPTAHTLASTSIPRAAPPRPNLAIAVISGRATAAAVLAEETPLLVAVAPVAVSFSSPPVTVTGM